MTYWKNMNKTEKTKYFKIKLNKGLCQSLKKERNEDFNDFMELFKYHPQYEIKLKNVVDLCIVSNKRNKKCFEINLIRKNGEIEDISYLNCINIKKNNFNLNSALRYTIEPQIKYFRKCNENKCEFCGSTNDIHIDHIIMFKNLVEDFLKTTNHSIPCDFDDNEYNGCKFKLKDKEIQDEWFYYHKQNAKLRCLCSKCNLTRKHTNCFFINNS